MIATESRTLTLDEFLALPEQDADGNHFELDEGELVTSSPTGATHARRVTVISSYLYQLLDKTVFDVLTGEGGILIALDPKPIVRGIDIAVLLRADTPEQGMLRKAPLVAIEVISPSNDPTDLERKRRQYQNFGVKEVWFVYETATTKTLQVYRQSSSMETYAQIYEVPGPRNVFEGEALGVSIDLAVLFE